MGYYCRHCHDSFSSKEDMKFHNRTTHPKLRRLCAVCLNCFSDRSRFGRHQHSANSKDVPYEKKINVKITNVLVEDGGQSRSVVCIETDDRPELVLEITKFLADLGVIVESTETDTQGLVAKYKFHVSFRGAALDESLSQVVVNRICCHIERPQTDEGTN